MKTYNQIIDVLQDFTDRHLILRDFGYGTASQLNSFVQNNTEAPFLYATIDNIVLQGNSIAYFIKFTVIDSRGKDQDNLRDIQSDTAQLLIDLRQFLIYNYESNGLWDISTEAARLTPLVNATNDWYSGWTTIYKISTTLIESDCYLPITE